MKIGGADALTYAVIITILTCTVHASRYDTIIRQVTDNVSNNNNNNHLIGTPTEERFTAFIQEHGKQYSTREEYLHRLGVFYKNIIRAGEHQLLDPTAVHGVTPFSDLTDDEFESMYLGVKGGGIDMNSNGLGTAPPLEVDDLPEDFDWREKGAVTDVKKQVTLCLYICSMVQINDN